MRADSSLLMTEGQRHMVRTGRVRLTCLEELPVYQAERSLNVSYVCTDTCTSYPVAAPLRWRPHRLSRLVDQSVSKVFLVSEELRDNTLLR